MIVVQHDQIGFITKLQEWSYLQKSISAIHRTKVKNEKDISDHTVHWPCTDGRGTGEKNGGGGDVPMLYETDAGL